MPPPEALFAAQTLGEQLVAVNPRGAPLEVSRSEHRARAQHRLEQGLAGALGLGSRARCGISGHRATDGQARLFERRGLVQRLDRQRQRGRGDVSRRRGGVRAHARRATGLPLPRAARSSESPRHGTVLRRFGSAVVFVFSAPDSVPVARSAHVRARPAARAFASSRFVGRTPAPGGGLRPRRGTSRRRTDVTRRWGTRRRRGVRRWTRRGGACP
jgi:hypothetical protein